MERYNIFNIIHKGLRAALYHTALQLQQTDFTHDEQATDATNRVKEIVMLFDGHADKEDHFILPAINDYEPSVAATFISEHDEDEHLGIALHFAVNQVIAATTNLEKSIAGRELTQSFIRFLVFNLNHMAKEESILNKVLWRYYTDEEIIQISRQITRSVAPWIQDFYATWMMRGINDSEAALWLKSVEKEAPAIVFQTLLQKAEQEMPSLRLTRIKQSLSENLLVA